MSMFFGNFLQQDQVNQLDRYEVFKQIEQAGFSKLHLAYDNLTNQLVYVKEICPNMNNRSFYKQLIQSEVYALQNCNNPHITKGLDYIYDQGNDIYYFVLPYCKKYVLFDVIKTNGFLKEDQAIFYMKQLLSAFKELRSKNIVHRDIKVRNIFCIDDRLDSVIPEQKYQIGTMGYMSPEMMNVQSQEYDSRIDIFALGVIFYQMLTCADPFTPNKDVYLSQIQAEKIEWKPEFAVSAKTKQLISQMTRYKKEDRISWDQLFKHEVFYSKAELENPYIKRIAQLESQQQAPPYNPDQLLNCFRKITSRKLNYEDNKKKYAIAALLEKPEHELNEQELYSTQIVRYTFIEYENLDLFTITIDILKGSKIAFPISSIIYTLLRKQYFLLNKIIQQESSFQGLVNLRLSLKNDKEFIEKQIYIHASMMDKENNQGFKSELNQLKNIGIGQNNSQLEDVIRKTMRSIAKDLFNQLNRMNLANPGAKEEESINFMELVCILVLDCMRYEKTIWGIVSKYSLNHYAFQYEQLSIVVKMEMIEQLLKE